MLVNESDAEQLRDGLKWLTVVRAEDIGDMSDEGIQRARDFCDLIARLLPRVAAFVRASDEAELAEAKARVAAIESRLALKAVEAREPLRKAGILPNMEEIDAGLDGYGEPAVEGQTVESFKAELKELRARSMAKRLKRS